MATIKSRRSATIQPQVSGNITQILVHSGDHVTAGRPMMEIDPREQQAMVQQQESTERQKQAVYEYNQANIERQRNLYAEGIISKDAMQQAEQAYRNSRADYEAAVAARKTQQQQLDYYHIKAPFDGVVGDVPVHVGDYVSPSTVLTTLDENKQLEAYIYVPAERASEVRLGLPVEITDMQGTVLDRSTIGFVSPQVDNQLQGILAKADVHSTPEILRNAQMVRARVVWDTVDALTVPVLAVVRIGGQAFVFVATPMNGHFVAKQRPVTLGDAVGNTYAVKDGLVAGDRVIVSGTQFLVDGAPVLPLP
jgi:RND family efflux transporter MFP subunit